MEAVQRRISEEASTTLALYPEELVRNTLKNIRGDVFVDVGACLGDYGDLLKENFALILEVEPYPEYIAVIKHRLQKENIVVEECAISDHDGEITLYKQPGWAHDHGSGLSIERTFHQRPRSDHGINLFAAAREGIKVRTQTLDTLVASLRERKIDLVKIDVEGGEFTVLKGAREALKRTRRLVVELHDRQREEDLMRATDGFGFNREWLDADHLYGVKL